MKSAEPSLPENNYIAQSQNIRIQKNIDNRNSEATTTPSVTNETPDKVVAKNIVNKSTKDINR